jgi:perosamine synthetase
MSSELIPVNAPLLNGNEAKYLAECIRTGWISCEGPFVTQLEEKLAQKAERRHGIAVSAGSAALDIAVAALKLQPGDEVILPTFTIISCASAIVRAGQVPVVVDVDPATWNMDVSKIAEKISPRTRAIMAVHIYGLPTEMDPITRLAEEHGLKVIEDAAEAIGQTYKCKPCGSFGDLSIYSFYPNKHIATGEGGMVLANDDELAERCRSLRNLCFQKKRFVHEELGWNYRMSNLQAAVGVAQLERLDDFVERKREMGARYNQLLKNVEGVQLPVEATDYAKNIYWVYGIVLKDDVPFDAEITMQKLGQLGIGSRPFFWPMHEQPVFRKMGLFQNDVCPVAERLARRGFYLPSGLATSEQQQQRTVEALKSVLTGKA